MDILNNSIVDTVIEYANVKFGVELDKDALASNLKELNYSEVLGLVDAIKDEDDDKFTDYIDLSAVNEGYKILPPIDREKYQERDGLEGPFPTSSGKVVYYDPKEGKYYDPDTDMYLTYDEWKSLDEAYGTGSSQPASVRAANMQVKNNTRDATNMQQQQIRGQTGAQRTIAGATNMTSTGKGANRQPKVTDSRGLNTQTANQANQAAQQSAQQSAQNARAIQQLAKRR